MKNFSLTEGNIGKALMMFVLPLFLGSLIQQLYITADAVIVGQFAGKVGLAAIDSVNTLFKFPLNFMNGLASGATIMISAYFGEKNREGLLGAVHTAITVALVLGVVSSVIGAIFAPGMLNLLLVPEEIYSQTLLYTRIYFGGLWSMALYNIGAGIMRAFGDSKRPLYVLIISSVINIIGDLILVGGFKMGVAGAALATVGAQVISVIIMFRMLRMSLGDGVIGSKLFETVPQKYYLSRIVKVGFPLALQSMLYPIANSIVQAGVNTMGTDNIAAWAICDKLSMVIWLIADSMGTAVTTYVAQNLGANKKDRIKKGTFAGMGMSAAAVATVSAAVFFACGWLGKFFVSASDAASLMPLVILFSKLMAPFYVCYAIGEAFQGACCGLGHTLASMVTTMCSICIFRVICIFFVLPHFNTMTCIIWIYIISWIGIGVSFTGLFLYKVRKIVIE